MEYPTGTFGRGVRYTEISPQVEELVRRAIETYTALPADHLSRQLLDTYESKESLAETFIGYSGSADLSVNNSYVRIDGPRIWMEFVVQPAVAFPKQLHYHALWRDKLADYGGEFVHE